MSLHPHQYRALVAFLRSPRFAGVVKETAFGFLSPQFVSDDGPIVASPDSKALGRTRFLTAAELEAIPEKHRPAGVVVVTEEEKAAFPTGLPGFPNKLSRADFDAAWAEARG